MALRIAFLFFSSILFALPLACGALAVRDLLSFRRGSFGLYARSSGLMAAGVAAGLCYYAAVVATFAVRGDLDGLGRAPLTAVEAMLFLQAVLAVAAVGLIRGAGRRLSQITRAVPGEAPQA